MADEMEKMAEKTEQERARQENEMARGPVSRGASNKDAPMYQNQRAPSSQPAPRDRGDYGKMIEQRTSRTPLGTGMQTDRELGSIGGGIIPDRKRGTGEARGGMATSNSTVSGGGTSAGALIGQGSHRDRGSMTDEDMDASTNNALEQEHQERGEVPTRMANQDPDASSSPRAHKREH